MLAEVPSPRGFGARCDGGIHCSRAFRRFVSDPPSLVGYCRWDGRSGRMTPPDNHTHDFTSHPFVEIIDGHEAAAPLVRLAEGRLAFDSLSLGVDVREADFDVLRPERHETPAHHVQAALPGPGIKADHRKRVRRRHVPTGRDVRGGPMWRGLEDELDLADIGGEAGAATHEAACLIGIVTALAVGPEGALAQRPPDKIRVSHLSHGLALRKSDWQKVSMRKARQVVLELGGREVVITNPDKPFFPQAGHTKLHLVRYYAAVAEGALRGIAGRPIVLKRYVDGAGGEPFFQKRAPEQRPEWIETVELRFPSGRTAREIVVRDAAQLLWMVNLGCIDLNPHPVSADDLEHPAELRVDLHPGPGVVWAFVRRVTLLVRDVLNEHGLRGWPKTSGSRGIHVNVRIQRRWSVEEERRGALALAREVERRAPDLASSKWWKEELVGLCRDYNQNAKDRTVASAWSVRPTPDARVSMPLEWDEVADCDPAAFTLATAPARFAERGD